MKILLAIMLAIFSSLAVVGQNQVDTVQVYFDVNQSDFNPSLRDNSVRMENFLSKVRLAKASDNIDHIVVSAFASPDGPSNVNNALSEKRCDAIVDYIVSHSGVKRDLINGVPGGIAWDELRRIVAVTPEVPHRDAVLDILDNTPVWVYNSAGKIVDGRKKQLMDLAGGRPYRWMLTNIFPDLRSAVMVLLYLKPKESDVNAVDIPSSGNVSSENVTEEKIEEAETIEVIETCDVDPSVVNAAPTKEEDSYLSRQRFAIKTNLLYDAVLLPNIEIEWLINDNWSVALEGDVAWWKSDKREKRYQLAVVSPEVKRWINPRGPWHGMYVGAFGGAGLYDLENGTKGYRGEGAMAGLSFGYMWPISKYLSLEAGIGAGYMYTRYKEYVPRDGHHLYQRTKSMNYFGPLKLKFSLVWRINYLKKSKHNNSVI